MELVDRALARLSGLKLRYAFPGVLLVMLLGWVAIYAIDASFHLEHATFEFMIWAFTIGLVGIPIAFAGVFLALYVLRDALGFLRWLPTFFNGTANIRIVLRESPMANEPGIMGYLGCLMEIIANHNPKYLYYGGWSGFAFMFFGAGLGVFFPSIEPVGDCIVVFGLALFLLSIASVLLAALIFLIYHSLREFIPPAQK